MFQTLREVPLGDMTARYLLDGETGAVELQLLPAGLVPLAAARRRQGDNLVQARLAGETGPRGYSGGRTMRCGGTVAALRLKDQRVEEGPDGVRVLTELSHPQGRFVHSLWWKRGQSALRCKVEFANEAGRPVTLELLSSFSLGGLSPYRTDAAPGAMRFYRLRSGWSAEARLCAQTDEELGLEPSWARYGVRCERFGQAGSLPTSGWFPWLVAEDAAAGVFWGAMLCHNASWQMELYRQDEGLAVSGGLADREFGHWRKTVAPGQSFSSPEAILTVVRGGTVDDAAQRMTELDETEAPGQEDLPVVYNEYCATWGDPSQERVESLLKALEGRGVGVFVIDAGWYKEKGTDWDTSGGDYKVSEELFPNGLEAAARSIRAAGMVPGLWFEPETVGRNAHAAVCTDHMLRRDGELIATPTRLFWNMRDAWVRQRLRRLVIDRLAEWGFGYVKLDYNDSVGIGCDGAESLGEALRQNQAATADFWRELQAAVPGILVENCASGGQRLDPGSVAATALSSFSDAHECVAIPLVAAGLHRAIPPRKSLVWAVLRSADDACRLAWSLTAGLLGRLCLSGEVDRLTPDQWRVVEEGLAFYRLAAPVIRKGRSRLLGPEIQSLNDPRGWQAVVRQGPAGCLVVLHQFGGPLHRVEVPLPDGCAAPFRVYEVCGAAPEVRDSKLVWQPARPMSSAAILFKKEETP